MLTATRSTLTVPNFSHLAMKNFSQDYECTWCHDFTYHVHGGFRNCTHCKKTRIGALPDINLWRVHRAQEKESR